MQDRILTFVEDADFLSIIKSDYTIIEFDGIKELVNSIIDNPPRAVLIDFDTFYLSKHSFNELNNINPALKYIPYIVVLKNDDIKNRKKALSFTMVSGILSYSDDKRTLEKFKTILEHSIPYAGSLKHTALTALINYEKYVCFSHSTSSLVHFMCIEEKLPIEKIYDTIFALNLIILGLVKEKSAKVLTYAKSFLDHNDMIIQLLNDVSSPKNIEGKIILSAIMINEKLFSYLNSVDLTVVDTELVEKTKDAFEKRKAYIYDRRRLNNFIDQVTDAIYIKESLDLQLLSKLTNVILQILERSLYIKAGAYAEISQHSDEKIILRITPYNCSKEEILNCIKDIGSDEKRISVKFEDNEKGASVCVTAVTQLSELLNEEDNSVNTEQEDGNEKESPEVIQNGKSDAEAELENELLHSTLHRGSHFENAEKYIEDLGGVDTISTYMFQLEDITEKLNLTLSTVITSPKELIYLGQLLEKYAKIIHNNFYEFEAISIGLTNLSHALKEKSESTDENFDFEQIQYLIELLINDLENWYETIFINQNVEHIHYLDSSLLSSCIQIEAQITNKASEAEDDNDLELF